MIFVVSVEQLRNLNVCLLLRPGNKMYNKYTIDLKVMTRKLYNFHKILILHLLINIINMILRFRFRILKGQRYIL